VARLPSRGTISIVRHGILAAAAAVVFAAGFKPALGQAGTTVVIASPGEGDVLQGTLGIRGTAMAEAFVSAELAFAYSTNPANVWFTISEIFQPIVDAELGIWDTTGISDGDYILRLRLITADGAGKDAFVSVQVRNYTTASVIVPTASPTSPPLLQIGTPVVVRATPTIVRTSPLTATPLPANTASLTATDVFWGFLRGGLAVAAACVIVGALLVRRRH